MTPANEWLCVRCGLRAAGIRDADHEERPPFGWQEAPGPAVRLATCPTCRAAHDPDPVGADDVTSWLD